MVEAFDNIRDAAGRRDVVPYMRVLDREPTSSFDWMPAKDRATMRRGIHTLGGRLAGPLPAPAGTPPKPLSSKDMATDVAEATATLGLTAGKLPRHATALDPNNMKAADFSRSEGLGDPMTFACSAGDFLTSGAGWPAGIHDRAAGPGHADRSGQRRATRRGEQHARTGVHHRRDGRTGEMRDLVLQSDRAFREISGYPAIVSATLAKEDLEIDAPSVHLVTALPGLAIATIKEQFAETLDYAVERADPDIL